MSQIWKLLLEKENSSEFLFTKTSATEAKCNPCQVNIKMSNAGPANVKHHLSKHAKYQKLLFELEKAEKSKEEILQKGMAKFVIRGNGNFLLYLILRFLGELSSLDRKVMHFIACTNQPFAVVESETFKMLLSAGDNLKREFLALTS